MLTAADISATSSVIDQITDEAINNRQVCCIKEIYNIYVIIL